MFLHPAAQLRVLAIDQFSPVDVRPNRNYEDKTTDE